MGLREEESQVSAMRRLEAWTPESWGGGGLEFRGLREEGPGSLDSWLHDGDLVSRPGLLGQRKPKDGSWCGGDGSLGTASCFASLRVERGQRAAAPGPWSPGPNLISQCPILSASLPPPPPPPFCSPSLSSPRKKTEAGSLGWGRTLLQPWQEEGSPGRQRGGAVGLLAGADGD